MPLEVADAQVAISTGHGQIDPASSRALTFNGQRAVTIPAGTYLISDPVPLPVSAASDLAISVYLDKQAVETATCHQYGLSTNYIAPGDVAGAQEMKDAFSWTSWCFVQSVDVETINSDAAVIVTLGDSITDGARSTLDANHRYPDYLATRLRSNKKTSHFSVINAGISGGRVLYEGHGPSALQRLDRDVLAVPGVRYLIYLEGINDIGQILKKDAPERTLTAADLELAATQIVIRAHQKHVKVLGATLIPWGPKETPPNSDWPKARAVLDAYNEWVRTSKVFDAVIDLNRATADPQAPQTLLSAFDSGDHVHPSDAGYEAMARTIDLQVLAK
jgi:lysophospholipase L1-like esterase